MDVYALAWSNHVIATTIAAKVDVSIWCDVMHKPRNFIGVRFHHYFIRSIRVDNPYHRSVGVNHIGIHIGANVIEPQLLAWRFETSRRCIVNVFLKESKSSCIGKGFTFLSRL